ncbi:cytochrome c biogenesis protein CcsA [Thermoactinomyces mirandus]|uniref:Cytochrome c biogenesis protein CcsA n=1 Tax=Thermoactinomyces mirandus TaxID=2756294 RepID=A0A7W1XT54_9BACL|nr:cytochrome c biogenesis protein CcsA [Thermoactinomyces mirandus]MBA4602696.1 cytochrome c biogenesis protein CcsA [Thermoactinomyces mirandus]
MFAERWIYDFMIYLYAISLLFSVADLLQRNKISERISYYFLGIVWLIQTSIFILVIFDWWLSALSFRIDALFIYSWIIISFTLVMHLIFRMPIYYLLANLMGFIVLGLNLFFVRHKSPAFEHLLLTELVFIHVTMAMMAYVAYSLACISGGLYLINNHLLKEKKWNNLLRKLPSLTRSETFSIWLVIAGTVFLLISLILGIIYAYQTVNGLIWMDLKLWWSFLIILLYSRILYSRVRTRLTGRRLAWWNVVSFLAVLLNYFITRSSATFHHWL